MCMVSKQMSLKSHNYGAIENKYICNICVMIYILRSSARKKLSEKQPQQQNCPVNVHEVCRPMVLKLIFWNETEVRGPEKAVMQLGDLHMLSAWLIRGEW